MHIIVWLLAASGTVLQQNCSILQHVSNFRVFSQGKQDGILKTIFNRIGIANHKAVEFGFGYEANSGHTGEELIESNTGLNTRLLRQEGWSVVYFDALINDIQVGIHKVVLTEDNIVSSFRAAGVPTEVDYVSIDVDSIDLWLLRALLKEYRPRVISVEFNRNFLSSMHVTHIKKWHAWTHRSIYGASAGAINFIAQQNGYTVVNIMPSGLDMFFVRQDLLDAHCIPGSITTFAEMAKTADLGRRQHKPCDPEKDLPRLVDLHLELAGHHDMAQRKAQKYVEILNANSPQNPLCKNS